MPRRSRSAIRLANAKRLLTGGGVQFYDTKVVKLYAWQPPHGDQENKPPDPGLNGTIENIDP